MHFRQHPKNRSAGFSLMEIIIVIALIAMLVGFAITKLDKIFEQNQETIARIFVTETLKVPLTTFKIHVGSYPSTEEGLMALAKAPASGGSRWRGPYVDKIGEDPWGSPYQYRYPGVKNADRYDIWSFGPDKKDGTADDIGNW